MLQRLVILAVSYCSDDTTLTWLESVSRAIRPVRDCISVIVVDNTPRKCSKQFFQRLMAIDPGVHGIQAPRNLGYFGGANHAWEEFQRQNTLLPDWTMVSNVDVSFAGSEFFLHLLNTHYPADTGVIGPSIVSTARHGDWNPKILSRPSRAKMHAYKRLYRSHWLFNLYEQAARLKYIVTAFGRSSPEVVERPTTCMQIYAPHGACILFSKQYFERGGSLRYPGFLFGEEVFVAETLRRIGLKALYDPRLRMTSQDHVSTGRFRSRQMVKYMHESAIILADKYFT